MHSVLLRVAFALVIAALVGACAQIGAPITSRSPAPRNIILVFADGAAATQWELGRYTSRELRNRPFAVTDVVLKRGTLGLLSTYSAESPVTDSAAAASAMSTGYKADIDAISVTPDGKSPPTLMEVAKSRGRRIGLVTTAAVHDASPAAFSVHAKTRREWQAIVDEYLRLEPDVLMGGGREYFLPKSTAGGRRNDGKDVIAAFRAKGYQFVTDPETLKRSTGPRLLALFADDDMDLEIDRDATREPSTADMTSAALRVLSVENPNGFVLFVENENTDTAGHRNDAAALIRALWSVDDAVQVALDFQKGNPDTLIIVTGDHETGGLSISYNFRDLSSLRVDNLFYPDKSHIERISRIRISLNKAAKLLGSKPTPELLDKVIAQNFPGFRLDDDLRAAILAGTTIERNVTYVPQAILGRMIARQTGFYWGTTGHTTEPVVVGAIGPGESAFRGYMDNTDFARALQKLIEAR